MCKDNEHSIQLSPKHLPACGMPWHTHTYYKCPSPVPRHTPLLLHSPSAGGAAPGGAQTQLSTLYPAPVGDVFMPGTRLCSAWPAHTHRLAGTHCRPRAQPPAGILCTGGRQPVLPPGEERLPPATVTAWDAPRLLNLPSAAPHVPPFRLGLAKCSLTPPRQAGAAEPESASIPPTEPSPGVARSSFRLGTLQRRLLSRQPRCLAGQESPRPGGGGEPAGGYYTLRKK